MDKEKELDEISKMLPSLLKLVKLETKLINYKHPIIHRISFENPFNKEETIMLQKVFKSSFNSYYLHSHSWDIFLKLLHGKQEIGYGFSNNREDVPEVLMKHIIEKGAYYEITDESVFHYTKPLTDFTISLSIIGKRKRERLSKNNFELDSKDLHRFLRDIDNLYL